jgi:hypothetical protein
MGSDFISTTSVIPDKGMVTWASEGMEGGKYHSRKLHVPSNDSGLTIGRGYDMKDRNSGAIATDLNAAGVKKEDAEKISKAAGLKGDAAQKFITKNNLQDFEIEQLAQKNLFEKTYAQKAAYTQQLSTKKDVTEKYGTTNWEKLNPSIQEMLVDLTFRGDYAGSAREKIQKFVVNNDLEGFAKALGDRDNWKNVPKDRFDRRKQFIDAAVADMKTKQKLAQPASIPLKLP